MGRDPWWRPQRCEGSEAETRLCQWEERLGAGQRGCVRGAKSPCGRHSGPTPPPAGGHALRGGSVHGPSPSRHHGPRPGGRRGGPAELPAAGEPPALPTRWPGPPLLGVAKTLSPPACVAVASATHRVAPRTHTGVQADTHRLTGMPRKVDRHTNTPKQKSTQMDTAPKNSGKDR